MKTFDELLDDVGSFGRYQKKIVFLSFLIGIPSAFQTIQTVFTHYTPPHYCDMRKAWEKSNLHNQSKYTDFLNASIPYELDAWGKLVKSSCKQFPENSTDDSLRVATDNTTITCQNGWVYKDAFVSATSEFNIVCEHTWIKSVILSCFLSGRILSTLCAGFLSDRFGRRKIVLGFLSMQFITALLTSFSPNWWLYVLFLTMCGSTGSPTYFAMYTLGSELTGPEHRNLMNIWTNTGFIVGYMFIPVLGYVAPTWRHLLRYISAYGIFYVPFFFWMIPESPRWLISKGHVKRGLKILEDIRKYNRSKADLSGLIESDEICEPAMIKSEEKSKLLLSLKDCFKHRSFVVKILVLALACFFTSITYYGLTLNTSEFGGDRFWNCFAAGASEFPAVAISYFLMNYIGRPITLSGSLGLGAIFCLLSPTLKTVSEAASVALAIAGKSAITGTYYVLTGYIAEILPTVVRSRLYSFCVSWGKIGAMASPFIMLFGDLIHPIIPFFIMGIGSLITGALTIVYLPETKGVPLPEYIKDVSRMELKWRRCLSMKKTRKETVKNKVNF